MRNLFKFFPLGLLLFSVNICAQPLSNSELRALAKAEKSKAAAWPSPTNNYAVGTAGHYLQTQFYKQCHYCGFISSLDSKRDYIPSDLSNFLRNQSLGTKSESMDINGTGFLKYIFHNSQLNSPLNTIVPRPTSMLSLLENITIPNILERSEFPSYMYSKNCIGIVKVALDASIDPPFSSFKTALTQDEKKESAIIVYEGWFISPITRILDDRNSSTTNLYANLWTFYSNNVNYSDQAYYIKQFKGLTIGRTASTSEYKKLEASGSINAKIPIASLSTDANYGLSINNAFSGSDYQTLIYDTFDNSQTSLNKRVDMYAKLPNAAQIVEYFNQIKPKISFQPGLELMAQEREHTHFLEVDGLPSSMCSDLNWSLRNKNSESYSRQPSLSASTFGSGTNVGCRFTIKGTGKDKNFSTTTGNIPIEYSLESMKKVGETVVKININTSFNTTTHPIPMLPANSKWNIEDVGNGKFKLKWKEIVSFADGASPVDNTPGKSLPCIDKSCKAFLGDKIINISASLISNHNRQYELEINCLDQLSYGDVDLGSSPLSMTVEGQFHIPLTSGSSVIKQISGVFLYPKLKDVVNPTP